MWLIVAMIAKKCRHGASLLQSIFRKYVKETAFALEVLKRAVLNMVKQICGKRKLQKTENFLRFLLSFEGHLARQSQVQKK